MSLPIVKCTECGRSRLLGTACRTCLASNGARLASARARAIKALESRSGSIAGRFETATAILADAERSYLSPQALERDRLSTLLTLAKQSLNNALNSDHTSRDHTCRATKTARDLVAEALDMLQKPRT